MVEVLPITLEGDNLGERHHCLNALVNSTFDKNIPLQSVLQKPETNSIDRIFKIDLASKYRYVDFVIFNLKEKDMLYVSRALRCKWLLEDKYADIINPVYLESHLYPEMTYTAVNKMKNWIELNLKHPKRCQEFYTYYRTNFDIAIKFLPFCSKEFILQEVVNTMDKLKPKNLKMLCETCPQVAKIYYDCLESHKGSLLLYNQCENRYFKSIMCILKMDGEIFLDIIEKYFDKYSYGKLSHSATKYIMTNYKNRYLAKPELYAGWLLNVQTLALFLNADEIKDIVTRLARAEYINYRYTYKEAEPFIKRLNAEERAAIKKKIFVDKSFGDKIKSWPYPPPECVELPRQDALPFEDNPHEEHLFKCDTIDFRDCPKMGFGAMCKKRKYMSSCIQLQSCIGRGVPPRLTSLDELYNRYRFVNFDKVLFEFRKLMSAESTIEGRRNMMLVLVSKAGGSEEKLEQLLKLLVEKHNNEPENLRDAVARSMVKRAFVWRLSTGLWEILLKWASTTVKEILHSTILRHLLENSTCAPAELAAYLLEFSDFTEYSLSTAEKSVVGHRLPALLISANAPGLLLKVLKAYNLRVDSVPGARGILIAAAREDRAILQSMFNSKTDRRYLLKESFKIVQTDASYMNALKHDVNVLEKGDVFAAYLTKEKPNHDRFLRTLNIYFAEPDGLAVHHLKAFEKAISEGRRPSYARPLAFLLNIGDVSLEQYISKTAIKSDNVSEKKFAAALRANALVVRPVIDIDAIDWQAIGAKLVSNKVLTCRDKDVAKYIQKCLKWKKTVRAALRLAVRNNSVAEILAHVIKIRPTAALRVFISDEEKKRPVDILLWNQIKSVILNLDVSKKSLIHVRRSLEHLEPSFEPDYWVTVFEALNKTGTEAEIESVLYHIENILTEIDGRALGNIISDFLTNKLKDFVTSNDISQEHKGLYFRIVARYLLISRSYDEQELKMNATCDPFFEKVQELLTELEERDKKKLMDRLSDFVIALKYTPAFLNPQYVCSIPMFERILIGLHGVVPREMYFKRYAHIHVTMLYCRAIRQTLKQTPEVLQDPKLIEEGVETVGFVLGKYIGMEINDLVRTYFRSIINIYQKGMLAFFQHFCYSKSHTSMIKSVIKGLVEVKGHAVLLAQYMFSKETDQDPDILKLLTDTNDEEVKFFLFADNYPD